MNIREIVDRERELYNKAVSHVIQSWEWGEFRKSIGTQLLRIGAFEGKKPVWTLTLTLHKVPFLNTNIGYLPKGPMPTKNMIENLLLIAREKNVAFIKLEPDVESRNQRPGTRDQLEHLGLVKAKKTLFTKYNFVLDLTKSEVELLASFHQKTRYNIKVAQKKGVRVYESIRDEDFEVYLKLYFETTKRQGYFGHTESYHRKVWETLKKAGMARVMIAKYKNKPLVAWMLLTFANTLYYPYGGSSTEHRDVMASNLIAWEAI